MKFSKSLLLGTAITLAVSSLSLSAVTPEELADAIRTSRACPVAPTIEPEPIAAEGWFSSFRKTAGNFLRTVGDELRTEGNKSAAGQTKEFVKDSFFSFVSSKVGFSLNNVKDTICNAVGNGLRTVGQWIKGGQETQSTTRVILDQLYQNKQVNKSAKASQVESALKTVARAVIKADWSKANEEYNAVVAGLVKRGYATKEQIQAIDVQKVYVDALSEAVLCETDTLTAEGFVKAVKLKGFGALENLNAVKKVQYPAGKLDAMDSYLKETYERIKLQGRVI